MFRYLALMLIAHLTFITFTSEAHAAVDYSNTDSWLCHPDAPNFCTQDQSTTIVHTDGSLIAEPFTPAAAPGFDCFYVYPTVSMDPDGNSDLIPNREEARVIEAQFARFGAACRTFAPIYRQITLTALRAGVLGKPMPSDWTVGYGDVKAAWAHYLAEENEGRGVILIGHSQGSGVLSQLMLDEIEGRPIQQQIIAAYLIGSSGVLNEPGKDVGGTFKHMPLCRAPDQNACVVTFASFRDTQPPPENSRFGRARDQKMRHLQAACNLPGALAGGPAPLTAYLSATGDSLSGPTQQPSWTGDEQVIDTPFVRTPGLLTGECVSHDGFAYLAVTVNADPADPRADDIAGDVVREGTVAADWGLHLIDMHLAMGNLIKLAKTQGAAYLSRSGRPQ